MKPTRTCLVCRQKFDKSALNRIYKNTSGEIVLDRLQKAQARATYICYSEDCHKKLFKQKALNRAFKQNISEEFYTNLAKTLKIE